MLAFAALVVFLAPFAAMAHLALVRHHWCSVHQMVEHDAGTDDGSSNPAKAPSDRDHDERHAPCVLNWFGPVDRDPTPAVTVLVTPLPVRSTPRVAPAPRVLSVPTLRFAPKTSPPLA